MKPFHIKLFHSSFIFYASCTFALCLILMFGSFGIGCNRQPSAPEDNPPNACFSLSVKHGGSICRYDSIYTLDASCSSDDITPTRDLEVRWDFDDDGRWDTDFSVLKIYDEYRPLQKSWTVLCQVRSGAGQNSIAKRTFAVGPFPQEPDLIAERIVFQVTGDVLTDTVAVGQGVLVSVVEQCLGNFESYQFIIHQNQEIFWDGRAGCSGSGVWGCGAFGMSWTPSQPGAYNFTVVLDVNNRYQEDNENNNSASAKLIVIP